MLEHPELFQSETQNANDNCARLSCALSKLFELE